MVEEDFVADRTIARGIYNEHFEVLKKLKNGKGWSNLPAVKEDALKFKQGFMEIGVQEKDITLSYDFGFDDFDHFFKKTNAQLKANFQAGLNTLVIIDLATHGMMVDNTNQAVCNSDDPEKMVYPFENQLRTLANRPGCYVLNIFNACRENMPPNFRAAEKKIKNQQDKATNITGNLFMILGCGPGKLVDAESTLLDQIFL